MQTLIILHGWQSSKEKWQKVKEEIESSEIKVIVPDIPGFKPETALKRPWNLDDYVNWLGKFFNPEHSEGTCPERSEGFFLLGHSFGGRIAIKFATKYPEKLRGLILVSAAGIKRKKKTLNLTFLAVARSVKLILRFLRLRKLEHFLQKIFYCYILRRTDYLEAKGPLKETMKNILAEDLTSLLEKVSVPTLIIWGKKDKITPPEHAYLMKERIKNSRLEVLEKIKHRPHLENPQVLAQKIKALCRQF